jgi:hypothetical protein
MMWNRVGLKENDFADRLSAFACGPGSPRTDVLGEPQSSLRDWSCGNRPPSAACWATFSRPFGTGPDEPLFDNHVICKRRMHEPAKHRSAACIGIAYPMLRATVGLNIFIPGMSRILARLSAFATSLVPLFQKTFFPPGLYIPLDSHYQGQRR